jgi:hypothetical protein
VWSSITRLLCGFHSGHLKHINGKKWKHMPVPKRNTTNKIEIVAKVRIYLISPLVKDR